MARALAVCAVMLGLIGLVVITQTTGGIYGHDPRLGGADLSMIWLGAPRIYAPTAIFGWAWAAPWPWPGAFAGMFAAAVAAAALMLAGSGYIVRVRWREADPVAEPFGAAAWGTIRDAVAAGFVMGRGSAPSTSRQIVTLGRLDDTLLTLTDGGHVVGFGSAGSGKTRTIVIPSLLTWASSAVVYTAGKLDVFEMTSGFRAGFSEVRLIDLGDADGWRFNPLGEVRLGTDREIDDCRIIAGQFSPPASQIKADPFWDTEGKKLVSAAILHVLTTRPVRERNLGTVRESLYRPAAEIMREWADSPRAFVREVAEGILGREERSRDAILGTAQSYLNAWASPIVSKLTSGSDFALSDLVCGPRPMTLYLRLPSDMREEWRGVLKVIVAQLVRAMLHNENTMPDGRPKKHRLGLILDEFHSFGFPGWPEDLSEMRSYGGQAVMITQSEKTLEGVYGPHQTISANCRVRLYLDAADPDTQQRVSRQIGMATEMRAARSSSWSPGSWISSHRGESLAEVTRELMPAGAVRLLPRGEMLLLATGCKPLRVQKLIDFNEVDAFRARLLPATRARPDRNWVPGRRLSIEEV